MAYTYLFKDQIFRDRLRRLVKPQFILPEPVDMFRFIG
jgi:hypothetical protein